MTAQNTIFKYVLVCKERTGPNYRQRAPCFGRYGRELASKTGDFVKEKLGGYRVERLTIASLVPSHKRHAKTSGSHNNAKQFIPLKSRCSRKREMPRQGVSERAPAPTLNAVSCRYRHNSRSTACCWSCGICTGGNAAGTNFNNKLCPHCYFIKRAR